MEIKMADEATVRLGASPVGSIKIGDGQLPVVDPHAVQVVPVDLITEARQFNGICALSFATMVTTPNATGKTAIEAVICARLRITLTSALNLRNLLDQLLKEAMPPKSETH